MVLTLLSYIALAREISILFAALIEARWPTQGAVPCRVAATTALGALALALE